MVTIRSCSSLLASLQLLASIRHSMSLLTLRRPGGEEKRHGVSDDQSSLLFHCAPLEPSAQHQLLQQRATAVEQRACRSLPSRAESDRTAEGGAEQHWISLQQSRKRSNSVRFCHGRAEAAKQVESLRSGTVSCRTICSRAKIARI